MLELGTARRVILSAAVPAFVVVTAHQLEFHVNERPATEAGGLVGVFAAALGGENATIHDTFAPRDEWWFWPAAVALSTAWLWLLWRPRTPGAVEAT